MTTSTDAEAIARKIMFVCESCAEGFPEGCGHYDLNDLRVGPDGRWLCESCYDEPPRPETPWIDAEVPSVNAILSYLASRREAQEPVAWLRDLDGTGSLHPASQGDPEAFAVYRTAPPAPAGEVERLVKPIIDRLEWNGRLQQWVVRPDLPAGTIKAVRAALKGMGNE